ncbi:unnamed protein product [Mytilus edulis]|uniref:Uncharacterized protein n=1 Tax=Mytilus edulis TaxID=6550 RepID=A0A8S3VDH4_MYTED|nr:unnamed protein product [Mytilus edulis]
MFIRHTEEILSKEDEFTLSCLDGDNVNTGIITCVFDESNKNFIESVHRFGKIVVEIKQTKAALRQGKKKQAQIIVPKLQTKTIENITGRIQQTIKTTSEDVRGCCFLPDGRMVFTCSFTKRLIVVRSAGSKEFEIKLPCSAFGVTNNTTDKTVIVSSAFDKFGFSIINIQDRNVQKFITFESQCYGLVERNGDLIFCTNSELKMLNLHTETSKTITTAGVSEFSYVDADDRHIYYTSIYKGPLTCCDFHGVIKWTFATETLPSCLGISVDRNGFLYVLSTGSVVLISPCGKQSRRLLSSRDGLKAAQALYFDKTRDILLVANRKDKAFLYKVDLLVT